MQEREVRAAKRFAYLTFGIVITMILVIAGLFIWLCNRPISPELEIGALSNAVDGVYLAWIDDTCYELTAGDALSDLCGFSEWKRIDNQVKEHNILSVKLADEYELAFYEGRLVMAYYGYSTSKYRDRVWYQIPENVTESICEYIVANGHVRNPMLGAASWFQTVE